MLAAVAVVALVTMLLLSPRAAPGKWFEMSSVCLVNTATSEEMTASEHGSAAAERGMLSEYRGSPGGCPLAVEDTVKGQIKDQVADWALGLRPELQIQAGHSTADGRNSVKRSFFLRLSRKRILLGFGLQW